MFLLFWKGLSRVEVYSSFDLFVYLHKKEFKTVHRELKALTVFEGNH